MITRRLATSTDARCTLCPGVMVLWADRAAHDAWHAAQRVDEGRVLLLHRMPLFVPSIDNAPRPDYYDKGWLAPGGEGGKWAAAGGFLRDRWPFLGVIAPKPDGPDWRAQRMRWEIDQAKAAGGDGFTLNIMGFDGWDWADSTVLAARVAAGVDGLKVVPNLDTSSGASVGTTPIATIAEKLAELYDTGGCLRIGGELVLSSFLAEAKPVAWWTELLTALRARVGPVKFIACFLDAGGPAMTQLDAFAPIAWALSIWGGARPSTVTGAPDYAARAHAFDRKWMGYTRLQDARPKDGVYAEAENTSTLRASWARVVAEDADLVQGLTWNDYAESTHLCPSINHGTALLEVTRLYVDAWRDRTAPRITRDRLVLTHRIHRAAAKPTLPGVRPMVCTLDGGGTPHDLVEVLAITTAPGTVTVGGVTRDVPAGITPVTVPLATGTWSARLTRNGSTVATVTSPHPVVDAPTVPDLDYRVTVSA